MSDTMNRSLHAWSPLRKPFFRNLWIANVVSLTGTWMHEVGVAWLMTSLTPSPLMVAMVQTATMLPFFLLALPAGAVADIFDRRKILLAAQMWMLAAAFILAVLTLLRVTTPAILLAFTFALSLGAALNAPAWQAIIPELVNRDELPYAVALGSVGFNIARVFGPALGGIVVAMVGAGGTFMLNALSFTGVMVALMHWHRVNQGSSLPAERLMGAMRLGIRYVRHAPKIRAVFLHMGTFSLFSSALWAFLPIVARSYLGYTALGYGSLLGYFGAGGLLGAAFLPRMKGRWSLNIQTISSVVCFAFLLIILAYVRNSVVIGLTMCLAGAGWMVLISGLNTSIQAVTPSWVRGRVLSVFMLVFFGGLSGGSLLWGSVALWLGIPYTLIVASGCLIAGGVWTWTFELSEGEDLDLTPSDSRSSSTPVAEGLEMQKKPVLVIIEYEVTSEKAEQFIETVQSVKRIRFRDGAIRWNLFRDVTNPNLYVESFIVESWVEHLRQHERLTVSDREILDKMRSFHSDRREVTVRHFILESVQ